MENEDKWEWLGGLENAICALLAFLMGMAVWAGVGHMPNYILWGARHEGWSDEELTLIVESLKPLYRLPDGSELGRTPVAMADRCPVYTTAMTYDDGDISVCEVAAHYPKDRMTRVLKHELIHVWIARAHIAQESDHGAAFMRKAIEVGTIPVDEF